MDILDFADDLEKKKKGTWVDIGPNAKALIASRRGPAFWSCYNGHCERLKYDINNLTPEQECEILGETMADVILLDWEGFYLKDEPVPYSREKCAEWCSNPALERFVERVNAESIKVSNFQAEALLVEKKP